MNNLSNANVDVKHYAFTTKSLYLGHMDYKFFRWQVIDTPGLLDRPLDDRNIIEMQSITALAHLRVSIVFILDVSELCGYTVKQQIKLFDSIEVLFGDKPLVVVCNKIDAIGSDGLSVEIIALIDSLRLKLAHISKNNTSTEIHGYKSSLLYMSTKTGDGVAQTKNIACEQLLDIESKKEQRATDRNFYSKTELSNSRSYMYHGDFDEGRVDNTMGMINKVKKDDQEANGGAGFYSANLRKQFYQPKAIMCPDLLPEIWDGYNIFDTYPEDIDVKLNLIEQEEKNLSLEWRSILQNHLLNPIFSQEEKLIC
jgi:nucleolar GTP-binding protein